MRLVLVELRRLSWRNAVRLLVAAAILIPLAMLVSLAWSTRPVTDADLERAEREIAQMHAAEAEMLADELDRCARRPRQYGVQPDSPDLEAACSEVISGWRPSPEEWAGREELRPREHMRDLGTGAGGLLAALALLIGATYVGADWQSGSMSNQLLFEPRRGRVWLAKAGGMLLATLSVALASTALLWAGFAGLAAVRDVDISGAVWRDTLELSARAGLLAMLAGLGGYALTMLLRATVGTLGILFVVAVAGAMVVGVLPIADPQRWFLPNNVLAVLQDGYRYYDWELPTCSQMDGETGCYGTVTLGEGVRFLGALLALTVAMSLPSFLRRDVP
jgi:ABC-2 type transport system permease protein